MHVLPGFPPRNSGSLTFSASVMGWPRRFLTTCELEAGRCPRCLRVRSKAGLTHAKRVISTRSRRTKATLAPSGAAPSRHSDR
eukprot:1145904-Pelagomonas_calceolata.AAC.8